MNIRRIISSNIPLLALMLFVLISIFSTSCEKGIDPCQELAVNTRNNPDSVKYLLVQLADVLKNPNDYKIHIFEDYALLDTTGYGGYKSVDVGWEGASAILFDDSIRIYPKTSIDALDFENPVSLQSIRVFQVGREVLNLSLYPIEKRGNPTSLDSYKILVSCYDRVSGNTTSEKIY